MSMVYSSKLVECYRELKAAAPGCLLLMQVGSFMQVQDEDARAVAAVTGLKLLMAGEVDAPVVLGGFPRSGLDAAVGQLVRAGHSVAIALQDEGKERHINERRAGRVNFNPDYGGVTVYPDHLEGYAWAENVGWIRLGTHTGGSPHTYGNTSNIGYGVNRNTTTGALSGYAWSTTAGWINFAPSNGGVTVSAAGVFTGHAWGENIGWIRFNGTATNGANYKVATTGPLAVTLASFVAEAQADQVLVSWETVSELDNAGFNLHRGLQSDGGDRALLASVPSQAPGSSQGAACTYEDTAVEPGQTYGYWLEGVDLSGATTLHGPVSATVQAPTAVTLAGFEAAAGGTASFAGLALAVGLAAAGGLFWRWRRQEAVR